MSRNLVFVVNHAAFFVSHRLPIALGARVNGMDVRLITGQAGSAEMEAEAAHTLAREEIPHDRVAFGASSLNPLVELRGLLQLAQLLRRHRPDVVHCASPKGVLYGALAARLTGVPALVIAISGMGYAFTASTDGSLARRGLALTYRALARIAFGHPNKTVVVQNRDDEAFVVDSGLAKPDDVVLIPGSGVDLASFAATEHVAKQRVVLLPSRMLVDKGVVDFVDAVRMIIQQAPGWRFIMAGAAGYDNPSSVPLGDIKAWQTEGIIEWTGHVHDMMPLYADAAIVCLPSYREGMPKVLLEAAAAGCAVVTTDVTGCREAVRDGETGTLVPVRDPAALARALLDLIKDDDRRNTYGEAGRAMARQRFSIESVVATTLQIYSKLQGPRSCPSN